MTSATEAGPKAPRSWPRTFGLAALTVWLPVLLPYWVGPLQTSEHSVLAYTMFFPIVPGALVPAALHLDGFVFGLVAVGVVAALYAGVVSALRWLPLPWGRFVQTLVIVAVAAESYCFAGVLRA